jgi:hypothetical protein
VTRYRLVYAGLGLALLAVVGATWALSTDGDATPPPAAVELIAPAPDATVLRQTRVIVDLISGYTAEVEIDGRRVPESEMRVSEALARYEWEPGPGQIIEEWTPGEHTISISWNTATGLPDIGSFSWRFRVQ